jgi:hypothetical protein
MWRINRIWSRPNQLTVVTLSRPSGGAAGPVAETVTLRPNARALKGQTGRRPKGRPLKFLSRRAAPQGIAFQAEILRPTARLTCGWAWGAATHWPWRPRALPLHPVRRLRRRGCPARVSAGASVRASAVPGGAGRMTSTRIGHTHLIGVGGWRRVSSRPRRPVQYIQMAGA